MFLSQLPDSTDRSSGERVSTLTALEVWRRSVAMRLPSPWRTDSQRDGARLVAGEQPERLVLHRERVDGRDDDAVVGGLGRRVGWEGQLRHRYDGSTDR